MEKLICVSAEKNYQTKHIGVYADRNTAKRVSNFIEEFAGENWHLKDVVEIKQKGVYNVRPDTKRKESKKLANASQESLQPSEGNYL